LARKLGANLINISGGQLTAHPNASPELEESIRNCVASGVLIVSATGNNWCDCIHVPAALPGVLAVGSLSPNGAPSEFSNFGKEYAVSGILAPGEDIPGALPGGRVEARTGTSFAAPLVTGVAALLASLRLARRHAPARQPSAGANGNNNPSKDFGAVNALDIRNVLIATATPCNVQSSGSGQQCRRFLGGTLNLDAAMERIATGDNSMNSEVSGNTTSAVLSDIAPEYAVQAQACGCGGRTEAPVKPTEEESQEELKPSRARAPVFATAAAVSAASLPTLDRVSPSCECEGAGTLVFAIGEIGFDYASEARRDSFLVAMNEDQKEGEPPRSPHVPTHLLAFLRSDERFRRAHAPAVTWTLNLDGTPVYAIRPDGAFAMDTYDQILEFYEEQIRNLADRAVFPGTIKGSTRLYSGQVVPVICPELRGIGNWKTKHLVEACRDAMSQRKAAFSEGDFDEAMTDFLNRIYFELRNMGQAPQERAINYAATNAFRVAFFLQKMAGEGFQLDTIEVEKSPICRVDSDCWDVKLVFFDTKNYLSPRWVARLTVDVSDVIPVSVGEPRVWRMR
jgi:cyanobactin maturation PatA/PatG family protease